MHSSYSRARLLKVGRTSSASLLPRTESYNHQRSVSRPEWRHYAGRPDAEMMKEQKELVAVGGQTRPSAPRGSLFALELIAQRYSAEELCNVANRFPFKDSFKLGDTREASSSEILSLLEEQVEMKRLQKIRQVVAGRSFSVVPILEGVYDKGNIGAVARSADALGYGSLHYVRTRDPRRFKAATSGKRTSGGAQKWLDMQVWDTPTACFEHFKEAGYCIAATSLGPSSIPITELDWTRPTAIILGNESYGVSNEAEKYADKTVIIPQAPGFVDSFNVSVACAITLYEARTSRERARGSHADLDQQQQNILTAAMLLRHREYNASIRKAHGLSLEELEGLDKVAVTEEDSWSRSHEVVGDWM